MPHHSGRQFIQTGSLLVLALVGLSVVIGAASAFVNPLYIIAGLIGVTVAVLIVRYEYFGLVIYLLVFLLRPGETYPALGAVRLELLLGASLSVIALLKNKYRFGTLAIPRSKLNIDFLLLIGALCLSLMFSACKDCTIETIEAMVKLGVFYLLVILMVDSRKRLEIFFWVFIISIAKMAGDIAMNFIQGTFTDFSGLARAKGGSSAVDNFNGIAITMNTMMPFAYFLFMHYKTLWKKAAMGGMLVLFVVTLVLTGSRGGLLGFIAILGMIWWQSKQKVALALAALVIMSAAWFGMEDERRERYLTIFASEDERDESAQGRIDAWIDGMEMFLYRPITGVGAGAFPWARVERFGRFLQPHSLYVQILAELGLIGAFIYFMFLADIVRINRRTMRRVRSRASPHALLEPLARGTIIACLSLLVTGVFAHSGYRWSWYLFAALTVVTEQLSRHSSEETSGTNDVRVPKPATQKISKD